MKRQLSSWASGAEIISSIAVVVTLVFLVIGIRENTAITRASVYATSIEGINDYEQRDEQTARRFRLRLIPGVRRH